MKQTWHIVSVKIIGKTRDVERRKGMPAVSVWGVSFRTLCLEREV